MEEKIRYTTFIAASLRNKPGRNLATLFCFAFIAANIFTGQFLITGAAGGVDRGISRMGADLMVVPPEYLVFQQGTGPDNTGALVLAQPSDYRMNAGIMETLGGVTDIAVMSPQLYVTSLDLPSLSPEPVDVYGIDPETDFAVRAWLKDPADSPLRKGEAIAGSGLTVDPGTVITLGDRDFVIAGRLDRTRSTADQALILRLDDAYLLAASGDFTAASSRKIEPGDVNAVLVRNVPGSKPDLVEAQVKKVFYISPEYRNFGVIGRHVSLDPAAEDIRALPGLLGLISVFVIVVAFPLIALIGAMVANERKREIGLLASMGAKRQVIFFLVFAESLVLAAAGGIVGAVTSLLALLVLHGQGTLDSALQVSFGMPSPAEIGSMAGLALFVVIVIGSISALWPAYRCSTMNPYDAIRKEGQ